MSKHCCICRTTELEVLHGHHVIPQACGGRDGRVVDICAKHHNMIHVMAVKIATQIRKGVQVDFSWPAGQGDAEVAKYLVGEIVRATLSAKSKVYKITLEFDQVGRDQLELLKQEFGVSSLQKAIYSSMDYAFHNRIK